MDFLLDCVCLMFKLVLTISL